MKYTYLFRNQLCLFERLVQNTLTKNLKANVLITDVSYNEKIKRDTCPEKIHQDEMKLVHVLVSIINLARKTNQH